jgi:hypothetical protein
MVFHLILFDISVLLALCLAGHITEKGRCIVTVEHFTGSLLLSSTQDCRKRLVGNKLEYSLYILVQNVLVQNCI